MAGSAMSMTCLDDRDLQRVLDGQLEVGGELLAHIDGCEGCRRLLAGAARLLDASPRAVHGGSATEPIDESELPLVRGVLVGRYVILDQVGRGAMGDVYAAYDPELDRRVALKLLRSTGDADQQRRLVREAQALGKLSHPNVVPVHDVGVQGARTFVAMELVAGRTLRAWLGAERRGWREVMAAFVRAGQGLAAAHAARIVHRDFKPDNVLVGDDGRVRVVDFGLAGPEQRAARPPAEGGVPVEPPLTRSGVLLGTPAYMAPELLAGAPATAASDQFAFAVALVEGLTGERPFRAATLGGLRAAALAGLTVPLPGVPSAIRRAVARALAPRPEDRFPSMAALVEALGHDRRRWWRVAVIVVVAVVLMSGWAVAVRRPEPCASGVTEIAVAWSAGRKAAVRAALGASGAARWPAVERALDEHARGWTEAYREACVATRVRGDQSETLLDQRMDCLRRDRDELRALTDVLAQPSPSLADSAGPAAWALPPPSRCSAAVVLRAGAGVAPSSPASQAFARDLAGARALLRAGQLGPALAVAQALAARAPAVPEAAAEAVALALLGEAQMQRRRLDDAVASYERAFRLASAAGDGRTAGESLVGAGWVIGVLQGHRESGEAQLHLARLLADRLADDGLMAAVQYQEGIYRYEAGDLAGAEERFERARATRVAALGPRHPLVADAVAALGKTRRLRGRLVEALADTREAVAILEEALGPDHPKLDVHLNSLATAEWEDTGQYDEAIRLYERARATARARGPGSPDEGYVDANLGGVLGDAGRPVEGLARAEEGLALLRASVGEDHDKTAYARWVVSGLLTTLGRYEEAEAQADGALMVLEAHGSPAAYVPLALQARAAARGGLGRYGDALADAQRALGIIEAQFAPGHPARAMAALALGDALLAAGRPAAALGRALAALLDATRAFGPSHVVVARALRLAGTAWLELGDRPRAAAVLARAVAFHQGRQGNVLEAARARWGLAKAGAGRELAEEAREGFLAIGSADRRELEAVERWLRSDVP